MFDENLYRKTFSQVKASQQIRMEVRNMMNQKKCQRNSGLRRAVALAAAVLALMAVTVTAFAAEAIGGWFQSYFSWIGGELSVTQQAYLAKNEQPILASKTINGWTVELYSAIHDGAVGYIAFGVTAPEGVEAARYAPVNLGLDQNAPSLLTGPEGVYLSGYGVTRQDDGDGKENTVIMVLRITPDLERSEKKPFAGDDTYTLHLENFGRIYQDESSVEAKVEIVAEGVWEFKVTFSENSQQAGQVVELLTNPVAATSYVEEYTLKEEWVYSEEQVILTSVQMGNLSVTFTAEGGSGWLNLVDNREEGKSPYVVLKDGTTVALYQNGVNSAFSATLTAEKPLVFAQVDYLVMANGTIIPMPQ